MALFLNYKHLIILRSCHSRASSPQREEASSSTSITLTPIYHDTTNGLQEGKFSLISIPLSLYTTLIQPILQTLLPYGQPDDGDPEELLDRLSLDGQHGFLNISVTPIECSIVCHQSWAKTIFSPAIAKLSREAQEKVQISTDTYIVFSVSSASMEAGQRVMDLTAPLAMAGIPIFFITTYYSDFILVPSKDRRTVGQALLARGFEFSEKDSAYVAPTPAHSRASSEARPPSTPPPSNVAELQKRTFLQLQKRNVVPFIEPNLHLVQCSGKAPPRDNLGDYSSRPTSNEHGHANGHSQLHSSGVAWLSSINPKLYIGLVTALISVPRFLSITLATDDSPSLLLDKTLLPLFGNSIAGDTEGDLVPIFLDLVDLPVESTGIVCGVAGKLVEGMRLAEDRGDSLGGSELSYLSTARAGAVILSGEGSVWGLGTLLPLLEKDE